MNIEELRSAVDALRAEIATLSTTEDITPEQDARLDEAIGELDTREAELAAAEAEQARLEARNARVAQVRDDLAAGRLATAAGAPQILRPVDPAEVDARSASAGEVRSAALKVVEQARHLDDGQRARMEQSFERITANFDGDYIARRTLLTEAPAYRSAFVKWTVLGPGAILTPEEQRAVGAYQELEMRAGPMAVGTGAAGGYGVPVLIDPTIILTSGASDAPLLRISRVETITTSVWNGVSSAGVAWSWDAEAATVSDDSPTLAQPSVTTYKAQGFVPYTIEVGMDYPGFAMEMSRLLSQGYVDLVAAATVVGSGSTPQGIFTAIDATSASEVVTTTDGQFGGVDVRAVYAALPERFKPRATWVMSPTVEAKIRGMSDAGAGGAFTADLTGGTISRLYDKPVVVTDYAPAYSSTTGAANILIVGDFSNYLIAQRAGMSVEQIPHLFDVTANRPNGQRGWYAWARLGADSVNDNAFRLLQNQ